MQFFCLVIMENSVQRYDHDDAVVIHYLIDVTTGLYRRYGEHT